MEQKAISMNNLFIPSQDFEMIGLILNLAIFTLSFLEFIRTRPKDDESDL